MAGRTCSLETAEGLADLLEGLHVGCELLAEGAHEDLVAR